MPEFIPDGNSRKQLTDAINKQRNRLRDAAANMGENSGFHGERMQEATDQINSLKGQLPGAQPYTQRSAEQIQNQIIDLESRLASASSVGERIGLSNALKSRYRALDSAKSRKDQQGFSPLPGGPQLPTSTDQFPEPPMPPRQTSTAGGWGLVGPSLGGTMVIKKPEQVVPDPSRSDGGFSTVKLPPFKESFSPKSPTPTTMNVSPFEKQYPLPDGWNLNRVKGKKNLYGDGLDAHYRLFDPSGKELPQTTQLGTQGPVGSRGKIVHEGLLSNTPEVPPHVGRAMLAALLGVVQSSQRPLDALPINKGLGEMLLKLDASGRLPITDKTRRAATNAANPKPGQSYVDGRKWFFPNAD